MIMYKVDSTNLKAIGWQNRVLVVEFQNNAVYEYVGVPEELFQSLMNAGSIGKYFEQYVKGKFSYAKIK